MEDMISTPNPTPDPEVLARPRRRKFSASYKLSILEQADACTPHSGEIGALLRREGLYSSHLTKWRRQRQAGKIQGMTAKKTGPNAHKKPDLKKENRRLERDNKRLQEKLRQAELIIDVQKKLSELLGINSTIPGSKNSS